MAEASPRALAAPLIAALDVAYSETGGLSAALTFRDWRSDAIEESLAAPVPAASPYRPGAFYERELPALLAALDALSAAPAVILVDGYAQLGAEARPGLGQRLWEAIDRRAAVIGVAKNPYPGTPEAAALFRGESRKPLFVTAVGMAQEAAKARIAEMHGPHRLPTLLKAVDRLSRGAPPPDGA